MVDTHSDFVTTLYYNLRVDEHDAARDAHGGYLRGPGRLQAWKDACCRLMPQAADLVAQGIVDERQVG